MPERDFLAAVRDRVVVFDGGMGATLEQFDLSLEDDYRLPGRAHEVLVLNRPDVIEGVHASMVEAGRRGRRDRHLPGQPPQARRVGPGRPDRRDQPPRGRDRPPRRRRAALRRRLDRADRPPPRLRRPDARAGSRSASSSTTFAEQARGLLEGGVDLVIIETAQDILEVKAADLRRPRGVRGHRPRGCRSRPRSRCCPTAARCCWAPTSTPSSPRSRRCGSTSSA